MSNIISIETIESKIYLIRGQKVMLDSDLSKLYGVSTKSLKQAVRRNIERFPHDFMFTLTLKEAQSLRSQFVTLELSFFSSRKGKYSKYLPFAFTENGIAMLSSVLKSKKAIAINIQIMRTFTKLRKLLASHKALAQKLKELEDKFDKGFNKHDEEIQTIFNVIKKMLEPPKRKSIKIGFQPPSNSVK